MYSKNLGCGGLEDCAYMCALLTGSVRAFPYIRMVLEVLYLCLCGGSAESMSTPKCITISIFTALGDVAMNNVVQCDGACPRKHWDAATTMLMKSTLCLHKNSLLW